MHKELKETDEILIWQYLPNNFHLLNHQSFLVPTREMDYHQLTMLSFMRCCSAFPLSPGGVSCLASTTAAVFTSPGGVSRLTSSTTAAVLTSPGGVSCLSSTTAASPGGASHLAGGGVS